MKSREPGCVDQWPPSPPDVDSTDPDVLRQALIREALHRAQAECIAKMQADVVKHTLDLLVRERDLEAFFGVLTKTVVEETESRICCIWLIDESARRCNLWMAFKEDRIVTMASVAHDQPHDQFPVRSMEEHLFAFTPGWTQTIEYNVGDSRLPEPVAAFARMKGCVSSIATPLVIGGQTLGWLTLTSGPDEDASDKWWRIDLLETVARQAALALHHSRVVDQSRVEERRKATLEERNRLARDIHDNLAQGFAAILMQLQGARREALLLPPSLAARIDTAVDLARAHLTEARRSVGTLRPNVGDGEEVGAALRRLASVAQRTTDVPIDIRIDELPRLGDVVEREIIGIAQEALSNAVRHSRAERITVSAASVRSIGVRLSVADNGHGIASERPSSGFGMTSMQERAERIGASLTIVTAPRSGTEVVLAWEPSNLPTQVHVAN
jgi:signal transduction histidine kinase